MVLRLLLANRQNAVCGTHFTCILHSAYSDSIAGKWEIMYVGRVQRGERRKKKKEERTERRKKRSKRRKGETD